jgi:serine/threonine protein kinase
MQAPDLTGSRYRTLRYIARGGMGSVWLAEDTVLKRHLAMKLLDIAEPADDLRERLLQEACVLAGLEHPGIVPVHDAGTLPDGRAFYCMKYVEGQTLAQHIAGMALPERLRLLERIAEPLDFAHAHGVIHRDLKPENIMIGIFGEVLVMDWGLAKIGTTSLQSGRAAITETSPLDRMRRSTMQGSVLGTPGYISPEQARGDADVDYRTDIFSLGAILWFTLTGSAPGGPLGAATKVSRPLRAICEKAMTADPKLRYQSAGALAADVGHYLDGAPVSAYSEFPFERLRRLYVRHRTAVILVEVYLLMRILFIFLRRP